MAERAHRWIERWLERLAIYLPIYLFAEPCVLCTFWLGNVLRATTARTVSTSQRPKAVRTRQFSTLYTWKCASRHNGCKFSSLLWPAASAPAALASLLFDPPETRTIGKHCVSRLSFLFAHLDLPSSDFLPLWSSLFWLSLSLSFFLAVLFHLSILSEVWLVNFLRSQCENVKKKWQQQQQHPAWSTPYNSGSTRFLLQYCSSKYCTQLVSPHTLEIRRSTISRSKWCMDKLGTNMRRLKRSKKAKMLLSFKCGASFGFFSPSLGWLQLRLLRRLSAWSLVFFFLGCGGLLPLRWFRNKFRRKCWIERHTTARGHTRWAAFFDEENQSRWT